MDLRESTRIRIFPKQIPNPDLKWERTGQFDIGLDLGLFNNRFSLEFDYYRRDTKEMLVNVDVPASVGLASVETKRGLST